MTTDGSVSCGGSATFAVTAGGTATVAVPLTCHEAPRTGSVMVSGTLNVCPTIDGVGASPAEVQVGGTIALSVAAHDSDAGPAPLGYAWTASGSAGVVNNATTQNPTFTCNDAGPRDRHRDGQRRRSRRLVPGHAERCRSTARVAEQTPGTYVAGDFHNHTTCSDGSISMQKLVKKSTDKVETPWGLDWFVQAGHGGSGNRNCTLVEDATLATPAYPFVVGPGPADHAGRPPA